MPGAMFDDRRMSLAYLGEKLEDIEPFHPDRMANRILGMGDVLSLIEKAEQNSEMDMALLMMFMSMFMQNMDTDTSEPALTPDGNLTLVDDVGSADKSGKQFITAVTKNGNYFYIIIDRDDQIFRILLHGKKVFFVVE